MLDKYGDPKGPGLKQRKRPVRYRMMASLVSPEALAAPVFAEILELHRRFIASGGGGGRWETFATGSPSEGLVLGIYVGAKGAAGAQAKLQHKRLDGLDLRGVQLPYADLCGVSARGQDLRGANLAGSLLTDTDFSEANFADADLSGADFSRSELARCNFRGANLTHTDFENADLTGADLREARLEGARFLGARMEQVLR